MFCFCYVTLLFPHPELSLRAGAHTGAAIRFPRPINPPLSTLRLCPVSSSLLQKGPPPAVLFTHISIPLAAMDTKSPSATTM